MFGYQLLAPDTGGEHFAPFVRIVLEFHSADGEGVPCLDHVNGYPVYRVQLADAATSEVGQPESSLGP